MYYDDVDSDDDDDDYGGGLPRLPTAYMDNPHQVHQKKAWNKRHIQFMEIEPKQNKSIQTVCKSKKWFVDLKKISYHFDLTTIALLHHER